jgi:phosphopantothenoylcysteine decarboxylase/phosphopantothenate--cysteine ligase
MARVVLGVSGGIAAYKAVSLLRLLTESGHRVTVVPTQAALGFVGAATWEALSGQPVSAEVADDVHLVRHVALAQEADLVVVAPATADLLARTVHGRADDLLASVLLTASCPVLLAPAMHTEMWQNAATVANVAALRERGLVVMDPVSGRLTGADSGPGRLPEPEEILGWCQLLLGRSAAPTRTLVGRRVVVSAGGTREAIDPVRFLGNRSSGKQGYAVARAAAARGAEVVLVAANVDLPDPSGAAVVRVESAAELQEAVVEAAARADVVVMAAAVADFRPAHLQASKVKKGESDPGPLTLTRTTDILSGLVAGRRAGQLVVGFAAETGDADADWLAHGRAKLARKGCDLLVVNQVGDGRAFGTDDNAAVILSADGSEREVPQGPKAAVADALWDGIERLLP